MTYDQFVQTVENKIKEAVKDNIDVCVYTAEKNNGTIRKGITLTEKGINISPTIYLEKYYESYLKGNSVENIAADALRLYEEVRFQRSWRDERIRHYDQMKEKIVYRVINFEKNKNLLREIPYFPYLDLAIVFCVLLEVTDYGTATMMIRNEHLRMWGVSREEVYREAEENTKKLLPCEIASMSAVMEELTGVKEAGEKDGMLVLSNKNRSYGAAVILYPERLKEIGEYLQENYYVLPSSIHEVIIVREREGFTLEELSSIVSEINRTQVEPEEILADHAYYYNREKATLYFSGKMC